MTDSDNDKNESSLLKSAASQKFNRECKTLHYDKHFIALKTRSSEKRVLEDQFYACKYCRFALLVFMTQSRKQIS